MRAATVAAAHRQRRAASPSSSRRAPPALRVYVYERVKAKEIAGSRSPVKTPPGLHAFVGNDSALKNYLLPLVDWAKDRVPEEEWGATPLRLYATAGMRLVGDENAAKLYDACHTILNETPFLIRRSAIKTISGEDEAFFGAVGANYAVNAIDADETPSDGAGDLVGALDLGGASTQVATALRQRVPPQLNKKHFSVARSQHGAPRSWRTSKLWTGTPAPSPRTSMVAETHHSL